MRIKVCGITNLEQANALSNMPIQYIGFIFYAPSKRYVLQSLTLTDLKNFTPAKQQKVGVFVNEPIDSILDIIEKAGLDMVQLHGDESVEYCKKVQEKAFVIKVFRVGAMPPQTEEYEAVVDYLLFDTDTDLYGGSGMHFNWELIKNRHFEKPFFLSGGVGANDIGGIEVLTKTKAGKSFFAIDINSKFETSPGNKDLKKIKQFIDECI